jgi:hypothetical protein
MAFLRQNQFSFLARLPTFQTVGATAECFTRILDQTSSTARSHGGECCRLHVIRIVFRMSEDFCMQINVGIIPPDMSVPAIFDIKDLV